jgi:hypothetical protein
MWLLSAKSNFKATFLPVIMLLLTLTMGMAGCQNQNESKQEMPLRDINAVMSDHAAELMALPGVTGVAVGELDDHTPCILVLVDTETDSLKKAVPAKIEGHPTKLYVTGKIVPMKGN